jgi:mannose-6-phosphate isomerase-like protein (cupin superfamily)
MLSGELRFHFGEGDALRDVVARPGDIVVAPSQAWHAFSNRSDAEATFAIVYDDTLEAFFREASVGASPGGPPSQAQVDNVIRTALAHGMAIRG